MFNKSLFENLDYWFLLSLFAIMVLGFINLWSASAAAGYPFHWRQLQWYIMGTVIMFGMLLIDYRKLANYWALVYAITISMLLLVMFVGKSVSGSQRWISLGVINLQPSEFAKLLMVIVISKVFAQGDREQYGIKDLLKPSALVAVPTLIIFKQPDLGTSLLILAIFASLVYLICKKYARNSLPIHAIT